LIGLTATVIVLAVRQAAPSREARLAETLVADSAAPEGAVVLLGDSIFEGLDATAVVSGALNFGIAGDTSHTLLNRVGRYTSLAKAHVIFIEVGINDLVLHRTREDVAVNCRRILAALPKQPRLYLIGILPIDETAFAAAIGNQTTNTEIAQLNAAVGDLCRQRGNCILLQPFGAGDLPPQYHEGDGLHLSEAGYAVLTAAMRAALAQP